MATSYAEISVLEIAGPGVPLVFIHGNSVCKEAFEPQFDAFAGERSIISIDLPGHGASSNARDPQRAYTLEGYADCVAETLEAMEVEEAVVVGWSLGGHIGYELTSRYPGLRGLMTIASPPAERLDDGSMRGFRPHPRLVLTGKPTLTPAEADEFAALIGDYATTDDMLRETNWRDVVARTDGLSRQVMAGSFARQPAKRQRELAENSNVPLAIVLGGDDGFVDADYVLGLSYRNAWSGGPIVLAGQGHAPHRRAVAEFNRILKEFADQVAPLH